MRERMRRVGQVLWRKDNRLPKIVLDGHPSKTKRKSSRPQIVCEDVASEDLREIETSWEGYKEGSFE